MKAIDRFYEYLAERNLKPTAVEKEIGLSNGYLSAQKKRNADMGEGMMLRIIDYCRDINPLWLLTGEGKMLKNAVIDIDKEPIDMRVAEPEITYTKVSSITQERLFAIIESQQRTIENLSKR